MELKHLLRKKRERKKGEWRKRIYEEKKKKTTRKDFWSGKKNGQVVRSAKNIYDVRARPSSAGRIVGRQRLKEQFMHASGHHFSFLYGSLHLLFGRHGRASTEKKERGHSCVPDHFVEVVNNACLSFSFLLHLFFSRFLWVDYRARRARRRRHRGPLHNHEKKNQYTKWYLNGN